MENRHRIKPVILERSRELRHPLTPAETTLWRLLRDRKLGYYEPASKPGIEALAGPRIIFRTWLKYVGQDSFLPLGAAGKKPALHSFRSEGK